MLTAARPGEVRFAEWDEVDIGAATWTVPANRMKAGREHRAPLAPRALEILDDSRELRTACTDVIFPGRGGKPMAESAFVHALDRLGIDTTAHGFRSSFRVWATERTNIPREVCEAALAHTIKDKAEAAYRCRHMLVESTVPVAGPLALGAGVGYGLGLFVPAPRWRATGPAAVLGW